MNNKIIFEDLTQPPKEQALKPMSKAEAIQSLRQALFMGAIQSGAIFGSSLEEISIALFSAAEDLLYFASSFDDLSLEKVLEIRKAALDNAIEKRERLKKDELYQEIIRVQKSIKKEKNNV